MSLLRRAEKVIKDDWHRESPRMLFNILSAFLITFSLAHLYSLFVPWYVFISGYHIHHFYYGMFLLAVSAVVGLLTEQYAVKHFFSYVTGVGIGLIVDELGLLLNCTGGKIGVCSYLFPNTLDVVVIISIIFLIFILFGEKPIRWFLPKGWRNAEFEHDYRDFQKKLQKLLP